MLDIVKPEFTAEAQRAQRNLKRKREGDEEDEYLRSEVGSERSSLTPQTLSSHLRLLCDLRVSAVKNLTMP